LEVDSVYSLFNLSNAVVTTARTSYVRGASVRVRDRVRIGVRVRVGTARTKPPAVLISFAHAVILFIHSSYHKPPRVHPAVLAVPLADYITHNLLRGLTQVLYTHYSTSTAFSGLMDPRTACECRTATYSTNADIGGGLMGDTEWLSTPLAGYLIVSVKSNPDQTRVVTRLFAAT
jgi:hypothetical protein